MTCRKAFKILISCYTTGGTADNRTVVFMKTKSIIVSHKEILETLFESLLNGLQKIKLGHGLFIEGVSRGEDFELTVNKTGKEKPIFYGYLHKGDHGMNDLRLWPTVNYMDGKADKFIHDFYVFAFKNGIETYHNPTTADDMAALSEAMQSGKKLQQPEPVAKG